MGSLNFPLKLFGRFSLFTLQNIVSLSVKHKDEFVDLLRCETDVTVSERLAQEQRVIPILSWVRPALLKSELD